MKEKEIKLINQSILTSLDTSFTNGRMKNLLANYLLAVYLLKNVFEEMQLISEEITGDKSRAAEAFKYSPGREEPMSSSLSSSAVEDTLEILNTMATEGQLINFMDYDSTRKVEDEPCLRLNYTAFYERFRKYCRDNSIDHEILSLKNFKKELMKRDYCLYHSKPASFRTGDDSKSFKTSRAAVLSIEKLKERKLKIDFLMNGQA